jgi:hypothetical protein
MFIRKMGQAQKYRAEADDGSKGGAGGGGISVQEMLNNPEIQKAIQDKLDAEVQGLKTKNSEVIGKLKEAQDKMKQFDGLDVEQLKNLQKQMLENEEMRLLAEGKTEEVVTRRVELLKRDYEQQLTARDGKLSEYEQILKQKEENLRKLVVDGTVREAYVKMDFEPAALEDVIRSARDVFIMDESGKVVPRDANGNMIFSKDGKTPIDALGWLELQAERKPYLRRPSKGAGAGNKSYSGSGNFDRLSSTGKIAEGLRGLRMS